MNGNSEPAIVSVSLFQGYLCGLILNAKYSNTSLFQIIQEVEVTMISSEFRLPELAWEKNPIEMENELLVYWKALFETTYFLRISTFYFEWNQFTHRWECKTSISQKVTYCVITASVVVWLTITHIRSIQWSVSSETNNPLIYFDLSTLISIAFYVWSCIYINWTRQDSFLEVFNQIQRNSRNKSSDSTSSRLNEKILKLFYFSIISITTLLILGSVLSSVQWDLNKFLLYYEKRASELFSEKEPSTTTAFVIFIIAMQLLSKLLMLFADTLFISTTLMFRALVKQFLNELRNPDATPKEVVESYKNLKATVILINNAVGAVTFATTIGALPFYCEIISGLTSMTSLLFFRMILYLVLLISSVILACRSHKEVGQIYDWLYTREAYRKIPHVDLHLLLHDISLNDIGLSSGGGPISYKLLGSILGLTATYVVIRFQFMTSVSV